MGMKRTFGAALIGAALAAAPAAAATIGATGTVPVGGILTVQFTLPSGGTYLDITTNGTPSGDTEIGLYAGTGPGAVYVPSSSNASGGNDDDGFGVLSTLSYGVGSGVRLGDSSELGGDGVADGEDGPMPAAGTYTVAIGEFSTDFRRKLNGDPISTLGEIDNFGSSEITNVNLTIFSDAEIALGDAAVVPLPAPALLLIAGLGGLLVLRRRRA